MYFLVSDISIIYLFSDSIITLTFNYYLTYLHLNLIYHYLCLIVMIILIYYLYSHLSSIAHSISESITPTSSNLYFVIIIILLCLYSMFYFSLMQTPNSSYLITNPTFFIGIISYSSYLLYLMIHLYINFFIIFNLDYSIIHLLIILIIMIFFYPYFI